jgi:hypothetical protein
MESKTKKKIALSPAKLAANRANALKSTGPRTPEGQRRSAANVRVKHGFRTHEPKLSEADLAEIAELEIHLTAQWQPATPESAALVREAVTASWRMDQILMTIDEALNNPGLHPTPNAALDRYLATAQATRRRARKALQANSHARTQTGQPGASDLRQRTQTGQPESSDLRQRTQTAHSKSSDLHTRTQTEELKSSISHARTQTAQPKAQVLHARTQTQITWTSSTSPPFTFYLLASNSSNLTPPPPSGKLICL